MAQPSKPWLGKYQVMSDADHDALEADAAINEFQLGMPRERAEAEAHANYLKGHAKQVAAHHLLGIRLANAANNTEAAQQHGQAYESAIKHLGLDSGRPDPEIEELAASGGQKLYSYKEHPADSFFAMGSEAQEPPIDSKKIKAVLDGLNQMRKLLGE